MRTLLLPLMVACCLWAAQGQQQPRGSIWEDPVTFATKDKDACVMHVTGYGDMTNLRVACQGGRGGRSYWCDYRGKPQLCRSYNKDPRHYFTQIMWDLRKLNNACSGPTVFKPQMCKKASDETRMVFIAASADNADQQEETTRGGAQQRPSRPTQSRPTATRPARVQPYRPTRPQPPARPTRPNMGKTDQGRPVPGRRTNGSNNNNQGQGRRPPTRPAPASPTQSTASKEQARKMAQDYCWRSLQGVCAYMIGMFRRN